MSSACADASIRNSSLELRFRSMLCNHRRRPATNEVAERARAVEKGVGVSSTNASKGRGLQLSCGVQSFTVEEPESWDWLFDQARIADSAGVDRIVVSDHVVFGERMEEYGRPEIGGQAGGRQPTGPDGPWLEPLTTLAVLAGMTSRVRLGTNIIIAALRRPVVFAKSAATLDVLSGGRLDLGVGVGWQREEYDAAGLDFEGRGRLLDHTLEVCQTFWREERARYQSPELRFEAIHMMPKPVQPGGVPFWVSGTVNARVVSRLARFGSGWIPWGPAADDLGAGLSKMRDALAEAGRDLSDLQVVGYLRLVKDANGAIDLDRTMDAVPALAALGVTDLRVRFTFPTDPSAALDELSSLVRAFRTAADRPPPDAGDVDREASDA
jgi:probable F420-dependent oxidoreductase